MQTELSDISDDSGTDPKRGERPKRCLSLTVRGPWGHFRRVDGNTIKATYRVMPRTTVAGLLAAIAGYDRDSYYDVFGKGVSGIAIEPVNPLRTMNLPVNSLTTSNEGMKAVNARGKVSVRYPDPTADRQRSNYEVLVDPAYRIDVWLHDDDAYDRLRTMLTEGRSYYTPSLGLSEHLAEIVYHGESALKPIDTNGPIAIESAIPDAAGMVPEAGVTYGTERSPGYMRCTTERGSFPGRRTTGFLTYTYRHDPTDDPLRVTGVEPIRVVNDGNDRVVVFA